MIDRTKKEENEESFASAFMRFLRELFRMFRTSCTFEEFLTETGKYFDERILEKEKRGNVKYKGGKITFTLSGEKIDITSKLYFFNFFVRQGNTSSAILSHQTINYVKIIISQ